MQARDSHPFPHPTWQGVLAGAAGGLPFGLSVWASADEISTALFGLAPPPEDRPLAAHTYSLLSHAVYGLTTEAVRKVVRGALARA